MKPPAIPDEVCAALERGRVAYVAGDYPAAETADRDALVLANQLGSAAGAARAQRLLGLVAYRRGDSAASKACLEAARALATEIGWEAEELLVLNHLGATLRKLGLLEEADRTFREGLERAHPRTHLVARVRLLASYGAFFDDLGDTRAAAEHYARHEELLSLFDDPGRLANARGLVSRAARIRGDFATALAKAEDEIRLARLADHPLRLGSGWMHRAQAHAALGEKKLAEEDFLKADELLTRAGDARSPIRIACARGAFFLEQGRLHDAFAAVTCAQTRLKELSTAEHEHRAQVAELAATVAAAAGLRGEALWHMGEALDAQLHRFDSISDERLLPFTQARRRALVTMAQRLLQETAAVERGPDESLRVEQLLTRLSGDRPAPPPSTETVSAWRSRVRQEAEQRWSNLLFGVFSGLPEPTRQELILADLVSAGPVSDLSRSLLLLFGTIERELRARIIDPLCARVPKSRRPPKEGSKLHRLLLQGRPLGIGDMVDALLDRGGVATTDDARHHLPKLLQSPDQLDGLKALRDPLHDVAGNLLPVPTVWRNDVAHGRPWTASRTQGDAVRRVLTLGPAAPLRVVVGL